MASLPDGVRRTLWNASEGRPRTVWRLLLGALVALVIGLVAALPGAALDGFASGLSSAAFAAVVGVVGQTSVLLGLTAGLLLAGWLVDRRRLRDFGLDRSREWWADLAFGLALGLLLPAAVFALELATGIARVTGTVRLRPGATLPIPAGTDAAIALALTFVYFVAVGLFEETLFRSYLIANVAEGLRWFDSVGPARAVRLAVLATSVAFGFGHATNPNATPLAVAIIALYGGFLAAGFALTGRVAIPIGIHVTWNFAVSSVFGFPVSGITTPVTLIAIEQSGPWPVTGGAFGPEGGVVGLFALALGFGLLVAWVRRREGGVAIRTDLAEPSLRRRDR